MYLIDYGCKIGGITAEKYTFCSHGKLLLVAAYFKLPLAVALKQSCLLKRANEEYLEIDNRIQ
jgi:hypothetical protein